MIAFDPWKDTGQPLLIVYAHATLTGLETMQAVADAILPYVSSAPVSIVYTRDPARDTGWTYTGTPLHANISTRIETVARLIADAVNGKR